MKTEEKKEVKTEETEKKVEIEKCVQPEDEKKGIGAWFKRQGKVVKGVIVGGAVLIGGALMWIGKTVVENLMNSETEETEEADDIEDVGSDE